MVRLYVDENALESIGVYLVTFDSEVNRAQKHLMQYGDHVTIFFQGVERDAILRRGAFCEWVAQEVPGTVRFYEWNEDRDPHDA